MIKLYKQPTMTEADLCEIARVSTGRKSREDYEKRIKELKAENETLKELLAETWEELRVLKLERNYHLCLTARDR